MAGIYEFCAERGFRAEGEAIRVGAWPTQFVPVFSPLTREAVERAESADFDGLPLRVVRAEYLPDIRELFERQAAWQRGRARLSWPEKVRMVEAIRESVIRLRASGPEPRPAGGGPEPTGPS